MSPSQGLPASKPVEGLRTFGVEAIKGVYVSSNFASADFRKIKTYNFQKS